jgi:hypothetical protein
MFERSIDILTFTDDDLIGKNIDPQKIDTETFEKIADHISETVNEEGYWIMAFNRAIDAVLGDDLTKYALEKEQEQLKYLSSPVKKYLVTWQSLSSNGPIQILKLEFESGKEANAYMTGAMFCDRYGGEDFAFVDSIEEAKLLAVEQAEEYRNDENELPEIIVCDE